MRLAVAIVFGLAVAGCSRTGFSAFVPGPSPATFVNKADRGGTYKLLYAFKGGADGEIPQGFLMPVKGTLYGFGLGGSASGCTGCGMVFAVTTAGKEHVVYSFTRNGTAGNGIGYGGLANVANKLYGTTISGGASSGGTLFQLTTGGQISVLATFKRTFEPNESLLSFSGTFFGTSARGGAFRCGHISCGTVFKLSPLGIQEIHRFNGYPRDGEDPRGAVTGLNGVLYGTTFAGGNGYGCAISGTGCGTLFAVTTSGKEHVIHNFGGGTNDGAFPLGNLINIKGTLYGVTVNGGNAACSAGCGTVFSVTASGKEQMVYRFGGAADGAYPTGGLTQINGTIYGTTYAGGAQCSPSGRCGTIFAVTPSGKEYIVYRFRGTRDGRYPSGGLVSLSGKLYGTTSQGGLGCRHANGCGTVFEVTP